MKRASALRRYQQPLFPLLAAAVCAIPPLSQPLHAGTTFAAEEVLFVNNPPLSVHPADLNGDGHSDLLLGGEAGLTAVLNQQGSGTFGPRLGIGGERTDTLQVADLDGDGDLDVLSVEIPGGTPRPVVWHRNGGGGSFSPAIPIRTENAQMTMLPPADVDGDGDPDILFYHTQRAAVQWCANDGGAASFAAPQTLTSAANLLFPRLVHLNDDSVPDLVAQDWKGTGTGSDDELVWLPGVAGTLLSFGAPQTIAARPQLLDAADVNGDGRTDLVVSGTDSTSVEWIRNLGGGGFAAAVPAASGFDDGLELVQVADLDADGDGDLAVAAFGEGLLWCRNDGASFAPPAVLTTPLPGDTLRSFAFAKLNADTLPDLAASGHLTAAVLLQQPAQNFGAPVTVAASVDDITAVAAADVDGDSDPDILFSTETRGIFALANSGASFAAAQPAAPPLEDIEVMLPLQLDGAGGPDLVVLRPGADYVSWLAGDGSGAFGPETVIDDFGFGPSAVTAARLDADGSVDLAVAFAGDDGCAWYSRNPGTNTFAWHALSGTVDSPRAIAAGDLDGDMDNDIVAASYITGGVHVWRNDGSGSFSGPALAGSTPVGGEQIDLHDADGDGDPDIFVLESSGVSWTLTVLLNDGGGAFPATLTAGTGSAGVRSVAYGDPDLDGDVDFVSANSNTDSVSFHENDGSGAFTSVTLTAAPNTSAYSLALADMDGDGDPDIISTSRFAGIVGWYRNLYTPPPPDDDPVTAWAWNLGLRTPGVTDLSSDEDGDGYSLLEEFAFSMNPLLTDPAPVAATGSAGPPDFWFTFEGTYRVRGLFMRRRDRAALGLTYIVETSPDLIVWTEQPQGTATNVNADYQRVQINRTLPGNPSRQHVRLRLTYLPPAAP